MTAACKTLAPTIERGAEYRYSYTDINGKAALNIWVTKTACNPPPPPVYVPEGYTRIPPPAEAREAERAAKIAKIRKKMLMDLTGGLTPEEYRDKMIDRLAKEYGVE